MARRRVASTALDDEPTVLGSTGDADAGAPAVGSRRPGRVAHPRNRSAAEDDLLRPVLEMAVVVARQGETDSPRVPAPAGLRPYLTFSRLPARSLAAARRVLEEDEEFRSRVAARFRPGELDLGADSWLRRPTGWERVFDAALHDAANQAAAEADVRAETDAQRRALRLEAHLAEVTERLDVALTRVEQLEALTAAGERASVELQRSQARIDELEAEVRRAIRDLKRTEQLLADRVAEVKALRAQSRPALAPADEGIRSRHRPPGPTPSPRPPTSDRPAIGSPSLGDPSLGDPSLGDPSLESPSLESPSPSPDGEGPLAPTTRPESAATADPASSRSVWTVASGSETVGGPDGSGDASLNADQFEVLFSLARTVAEASGAAAALGAHLGASAELLATLIPDGGADAGPGKRAPFSDTAPSSPASGPTADAAGAGPGSAGTGPSAAAQNSGPEDPLRSKRPSAGPGGRSRGARRVPVRPRRGLVAGTPAAVEELLSTPGVIVLVDGYNASIAIWPQLALPNQREALLSAMERIHARTGAEIRIIYDGNERGGPTTVAVPLRVRVEFTPHGEEADDRIIGLAETLPQSRPLVVVSADRRVQAGVRKFGATLLAPAQLREYLNP